MFVSSIHLRSLAQSSLQLVLSRHTCQRRKDPTLSIRTSMTVIAIIRLLPVSVPMLIGQRSLSSARGDFTKTVVFDILGVTVDQCAFD